jgi:hypothetical protein
LKQINEMMMMSELRIRIDFHGFKISTQI